MPASGRRTAGFAGVERGGDGERIGVDLAHRVEQRAGAVVGLDPRQIGLHQCGGGDAAGGERLLQLGDRGVGDVGLAIDDTCCPVKTFDSPTLPAKAGIHARNGSRPAPG